MDKRYNVDDGKTLNVFRQRFRQLLDSRGLNRAELATNLNMNRTSISKYLIDRAPDIFAAWRIADYFNVSIDWLLGRTDERYSHLPSKSDSILVKKYLSASETDKHIIDTLLSKYDV